MNSEAVTHAVRPLLARGQHNPRDFDKYVWQLPIPLFDPNDHQHAQLVGLAATLEALVAGIVIQADRSFESSRRDVRAAIGGSSAGIQLEQVVVDLLGRSGTWVGKNV